MDDRHRCGGSAADREQTVCQEELSGRKVLALRSGSPGGAGVNTSEGQQVWLCWDLEPAADVLLWMLPAGMGAVEGGNHRESLFSRSADIR